MIRYRSTSGETKSSAFMSIATRATGDRNRSMSARGSPLLPPVPSGELSELRLWVERPRSGPTAGRSGIPMLGGIRPAVERSCRYLRQHHPNFASAGPTVSTLAAT